MGRSLTIAEHNINHTAFQRTKPLETDNPKKCQEEDDRRENELADPECSETISPINRVRFLRVFCSFERYSLIRFSCQDAAV